MGGAILRKDERMGFLQLFDDESSTYTYLLWDPNTKESILVDPVDIQVDRDMKAAEDLGLKLVYGGQYEIHSCPIRASITSQALSYALISLL